jgi:hypothetical protein
VAGTPDAGTTDAGTRDAGTLKVPKAPTAVTATAQSEGAVTHPSTVAISSLARADFNGAGAIDRVATHATESTVSVLVAAQNLCAP